MLYTNSLVFEKELLMPYIKYLLTKNIVCYLFFPKSSKLFIIKSSI